MSIIKICGLTLIIYKVISLSKQQFLTINYQYTAHVHTIIKIKRIAWMLESSTGLRCSSFRQSCHHCSSDWTPEVF